ncbi:MAG TPA: CvpA family protein [Bryobacteraceae bacterium]|jgi:membrane protein required for colicin V production|nr:CvpA family protein [Bryobacteraceae bacterium]
MNWIDITLAVMLIVSVVSGLKLGFVRTAIGLLSSILALVFGLHYYRAVAVTLRPYISQTLVADLAGFLIVFVGITILGEVVTGILARFVHSTDLVWLDRALGGAFGVVRGFLFGAIAIWLIMALMPVPPKLVLSESRLAPCVMDVARRVADASPDEVKRTFRQSYRELNRVLPEKIKDRLPSAAPGQI